MNDLEECFRLAAETGDDAKLLRALARNPVYLAQPLLATVVGKDGRTYVLAFTSEEAIAARDAQAASRCSSRWTAGPWCSRPRTCVPSASSRPARTSAPPS